MKKLFSLSFLILLAMSCRKEDNSPQTDDSVGLQLEITEINSASGDTYLVDTKDFIKVPIWESNSTEGISIERKAVFKTQNPSLEVLDIELWFRRIEKKDKLDLSNEIIAINSWDNIKDWNYKSTTLERADFYSKKASSGLSINGLVPSGEPFQFEVTESKEIEVEGKTVTWVHIDISGTLYPIYTPGEGQGLRVKGSFEGVLE